MKVSTFYWLIILLWPFFCVGQQYDLNKSVLLKADIQLNPPSIDIRWEKSSKIQSIQVFRKKAEASEWGEPIATLKGNATHFTDKEIVRGESYEYKVWQKSKHATAFGYMYSAIGKPVVHFRGKVILVVDNTVALPLKQELKRFVSDLEGDGWEVVRVDVSRHASPQKVKQRIKGAYYADPDNTNSLILFGHVPVPYSGNIHPDKHVDHKGAWPADTYYSDIDGVWTDSEVNYAKANEPRNHNVPNDGKFDQNLIPTPPELRTGRIDFANLPAFQVSEIDLLRAYLDKNHEFRQKKYEPRSRGLIENNFKSFSEGFAQNGWKNFSPLVGPENITKGNYNEDLRKKSYLWSYGCGAGSFASSKGIISSEEFAKYSINSTFNLLFGSYFGDWDSEDNLLRASLGSGKILATCWAGRPNWQFHHMSLGNPIGYSVVLSQKNHVLYNPGYGARNIHMGLLGDPTLRMKMTAPPKDVRLNIENEKVNLSWLSPNEDVVGYHIYRKKGKNGNWELLNAYLVTSNEYTDSCLPVGEYVYMVRTIKLETSPSGTYYNLSQGTFSESVKIREDWLTNPDFNYSVEGRSVTFNNLTENATDFTWTFGDGTVSKEVNPIYKYTTYGNFIIGLEATNQCGSNMVEVQLDLIEPSQTKATTGLSGFNIFPNPTSEYLNIHIYSNSESSYQVRVFDLDTRLMKENVVAFQGNSTLYTLDIRDLSKGVYIIQVFDQNGKIGAKKFVQN
ncbi:MAG: T9SS type A sorting domain-containing protein [Bacteroidota bacterium]